VTTRPSGATRALLAPIVAYRRWVSPALPARCRFYPTCSAYAVEALVVHGAARGFGLAAGRLLRCHPFHLGGYDPVPPGRGGTGPASRLDPAPGAPRWT